MMDTLPTVVAENLKRLRASAGVSMGGLAESARRNGVRLNSGTVAKLEAAQHRITVEHLVVVAIALSDVLDRPVSFLDLLESDEPIIVAGLVFEADAMTKLFAPQGIARNDFLTSSDVDAQFTESMRDAAEALRSVDFRELQPGRTMHFWRRASDLTREVSEADQRIARTMSLPLVTFHDTSMSLWGHSFTQERDQRAGPDANAQKRGRITRDMKAELRQAIEAERGND